MPAHQPNGNEAYIWGSHEDRLQKVEAGVSEVMVALTETRSMMQNGIENLGAKLDASADRQDDISRKLDGIHPRLEKLEGAQRARTRRKNLIRNTVIALFLTGAGAFLAKLGEKLWELLSGQ